MKSRPRSKPRPARELIYGIPVEPMAWAKLEKLARKTLKFTYTPNPPLVEPPRCTTKPACGFCWYCLEWARRQLAKR